MISQFFVLSARGDILISRDYRGDVVRGTAEIFFRKIKAMRDDVPPIFNMDGINFVYIKKHSLYFVCTTQFNASPLYVLQVLTRCTNVFKDYCGSLNEETFRNNFVLIYELLDEMLDFGYPQDTSTEHLKTYIVNEPVDVTRWAESAAAQAPVGSGISIANLKNLAAGIGGKAKSERKTMSSVGSQKPLAASAIGSHGSGKDEIFVDLLERLTVLFSANGQILRSEIDGCIQMKSYLSGNPILKLGLNEDLIIGRNTPAGYGQVVVDDINFHECVNLDEFEHGRVLSFNPPEGEFVAMNYRLTSEFRAPFRVFPFIEEIDASRFDFIIKIRADFPEAHHGNNVSVRIPLPKSTVAVSSDVASAGGGQAFEYRADEKQATWMIRKFPGGSENSLRLTVTVGSGTAGWRKEVGPVSLDFELPMYNCSNMTIRFLRLFEREGYNPYRWVRYITHSDSYVCRV